MEQFDYIVLGGGLSGLSLIVNLIDRDLLEGKSLLLLEKDTRQLSDRTWCYWDIALAESSTRHLNSHSWEKASFESKQYNASFDLKPYEYNCIRGRDFYSFALEKILKNPQVTIRQETVRSVREGENNVTVETSKFYTAAWVFSSIVPRALIHQPGKHYLLQHFKGWWLTMQQPVFDPSTASLFDFNCPVNSSDPQGGNTFVYILALSKHSALVEYTIFSRSLAGKSEYEQGIQNYLSAKFPGVPYTIDSSEEGVIPMTNHFFPPGKGRITYLGTAGGQTKPSSGFTFQFVQKHSRLICNALHTTGTPWYPADKKATRFSFYDSVFLRILAEGTLSTEAIFARLFKRNPAWLIFRFLDNETSISQELRLLSSLQIGIFTRAALKELGSKFRIAPGVDHQGQ